MTDTRQVLEKTHLFSGLSATELEELISFAQSRSFAAGSGLFRQGDESDGMHVITKGKVKLTARVAGDESVDVATLGRGQLIGELALVDQGVRNASAAAASQVSTLFFSQRTFQTLRADARPAAVLVMLRIAEGICRRVRNSVESLHDSLVGRGRQSARPAAGARSPQPLSSLNLEHLRSIPLFAAFGDDGLKRLLQHCELFEAPRDTLLYERGTESSGLLLVVRGALRLALPLDNGTEEQIGIFGPGRVVGAVPVLDGLTHDLRCATRESARFLRLPNGAFAALTESPTLLGGALFDAITTELVRLLRSIGAHRARLAVEGLIDTH